MYSTILGTNKRLKAAGAGERGDHGERSGPGTVPAVMTRMNWLGASRRWPRKPHVFSHSPRLRPTARVQLSSNLLCRATLITSSTSVQLCSPPLVGAGCEQSLASVTAARSSRRLCAHAHPPAPARTDSKGTPTCPSPR